MALKAFSHICAFRTLATSSDRAGFCPYATGAATAPAPGLSLRPGGSDQACRSHRRGGSRAHLPHARSSRFIVADICGGTSLPLPAPLARRVRGVVHPSSRGGGLARTPQQLLARRDADHLRHLGFGRRSWGSGGLVGARAGLPRVPHLVPGRPVVAGVDDSEHLSSALKGDRRDRS